MSMRKIGVFLLFLATAGALPAGAHAACAKITPTQPGEVYLMRGLANIFSLGLDQYGKELSSRGIENCVFNHSHWQSIVNDIVERSYRNAVSEPIMIVGHSLGAGVAPKMATSLARHNIAVAYVEGRFILTETFLLYLFFSSYFSSKSQSVVLFPTKIFFFLL